MNWDRFTENRWMKTIFGVVISLLIATAVLAGVGWEREKSTRDGIVVYSRTTSGTTIREVRARMTIAASPEVILDAACDPSTFGRTTKKYVEKNQFYEVHDRYPNVWYNYQLVNFPVVARRDYCLRYEKIEKPERGIYRLEWRISDRFGPPPTEGVVRVSNIRGSIIISKDESSSLSTVRYTLMADPGGNIPTWIINLANRSSLPDILRELRDASLERLNKSK
jgi:hypothetical protein